MTAAAIVLAGGRATRMHGVDKAAVAVHGRRLVDAVYDAVADADPVIAVGPESITRDGVTVIREEPPFGGPVAALAAALAALDRTDHGRTGHGRTDRGGSAPDETWLLACDLPRAGSIVAQLQTIPIPEGADAVILVDGDGREQWLAGRYRIAALRHALASLPAARDVSMRRLAAALTVHPVTDRIGAAHDLDTWAELERYRSQSVSPSGESAMSTYPPGLDRWVAELTPVLGLDDPPVPSALLLEVTRDVAHGVLRPAGPVTTYLIGLAVAGGMSAADAAARVQEVLQSRESGADDRPGVDR